MTVKKFIEQGKIATADIQDNQQKTVLYTAILLGGWFLTMRLIVAITQVASGYVLGGFADMVMLAALGFGFSGCISIIHHNFGYIRRVALTDEHFPRAYWRYWRGLRFVLITVFLLAALVYWLGIIAAFILFHGFKRRNLRKLGEEYIKGTRLTSPAALNKFYLPQIQQAKSWYWFGGVLLPSNELVTHAKIMGSSGSGKTQLLRIYMRSVLSLIGSIPCEDRAILFDPMSEFYPFLRGLGIPESAIIILNPFDARACAWDIAAEFTRLRDAATVANIMIPEKKASSGNNDFFDRAARRVLSGLAKFFIKNAPGRWTLRDLVLGAQSMELVGLLAAHDRKLKRDLQSLGVGDTAGNVLATLAAVIGDELETIAAYMDYHQRQGRVFTLEQWFDSSSILLLGCDRESEATLQPYNQLLVTRFCELATSSHHPGFTHAIFDELPALGNVGKKLDELARMGRRFNLSLAIAFQAYSSLKEIYGENVANALMGQCDKSAYLRVLDHDSAEWASKQIGQTHLRRYTQSTSTSQSTNPNSFGASTSYSTSEQETYVTEPAVRPEEIMNIPKPNKVTGQGVKGFYKVASSAYPYYMESSFMSQAGVVDDPLSAGFEAIENVEEAEELRLWEEEDLRRLGIFDVVQMATEKQLQHLPISELIEYALKNAPKTIVAEFQEIARDTD